MDRAFSPRIYFVCLSWGGAPGWYADGPLALFPVPTGQNISAQGIALGQRTSPIRKALKGRPIPRAYEAQNEKQRHKRRGKAGAGAEAAVSGVSGDWKLDDWNTWISREDQH